MATNPASASASLQHVLQPDIFALNVLRRNALQTGISVATIAYAAMLLRRAKDKRLEAELGPEPGPREEELASSDPGLLAKYSSYKTIQTSVARYPAVRVFYKAHAQAEKLPSDPPLPLLVFLHGLGGSLSQLHLLLTSLVNVGPCFGIDLPGCGLSRFVPSRWDAYTYEALVDIWAKAIEDYCDTAGGQKVILIGHSMGCMISQSLAARSKSNKCSFDVLGLVAICPPVQKISATQKLIIGALLSIPTPIFDLWRAWDKRGGINSDSVTRFVGSAADQQTRELQLKFNDQSQTPVFRRFAWGAVSGSTPSAEQWAAMPLSVRVLLIGAEDDPVTPVRLLHKIKTAIESSSPPKVLKATILPGSHALPFDHNNYRSVAGVIESFLGDLDPRLSLGWQLNYLATEGKWDVKNLEKWTAIEPVSEPIGKPTPVFRAMKTMREIDDAHSPKHFVANWRDKIAAVIDISHDTPVYDPKSLDEGGIEYHKFPTVSKYPPDENEVRNFGILVDKILEKMKDGSENKQIAVHCHYGFNRTGYFIATYLIEKMGYSVRAAIDEFAEKRPPGIRHDHFLDTMFMRYSNKRS